MSMPITFHDIVAAHKRLSSYIKPTPLRSYKELDQLIGSGIQVFVKHENFQPTGAFKIRNALSALSALSEKELRSGVVAATRGNHGLGVSYAAKLLHSQATICVPLGNNPEKNSGIKALGGHLIEKGRDYDEAIAVMKEYVAREGLTEIHSTNNRNIIAGAGTMTLEILTEAPHLDALVIAVGGGSQAVGAIVAAKAVNPHVEVYGVQAEGAAAIHDSWHQGKPLSYDSARTIADGLATRSTYEMTFAALQQGLTGFVTVSDKDITTALKMLLQTTHSMVEAAGAAGLAGVFKLRSKLAGKAVGIAVSGGNIDQQTLLKVLSE